MPIWVPPTKNTKQYKKKNNRNMNNTYFSNILCAVKLRVLGLMAYWYTGSAFHQISQSYLQTALDRDYISTIRYLQV